MANAAQKLSPDEVAEELDQQPLVGVTVASRILNIKPPNFRRDAAPHLIAVKVEGSANVYFRSDVQRLADEWEASGRRTNGSS